MYKKDFQKRASKGSYRPKKIRSFSRGTSNKSQSYSYSKNKKSLFKRIFLNKNFIYFTISVFLILVIASMLLLSWIAKDLPNPNQLIERDIAQSTIIYDRTGEHALYEFHGDEKRTLIDIDEIPDHAKQATIAMEDRNFYKHKGISLLAIIRTAFTNIVRNERAGGSTLTQQFVKNALLTSEKKYSRKIKEILIAQNIEKRFEKDEILQMYLNEIPYGSNAYGIEAASQKYFGKSAKDLVLAESAVLAALPQAPSRYSPYGPNKDLLLGRQKYILKLMEEQGYISNEERVEAENFEVVFEGPETNILAPHFVMLIREMLSDEYGIQTLEQGGLRIFTTLDLDKQKIAEKAVQDHEARNQEDFNASNAALVAIDPKNGQVLAMVGSKDYFNQDIDGQVNIAIRPRQPGSSLKPLVYASLFTKGYTPNTLLYDVVTNFSNSGEAYEPRNYNNQESGPVSVRRDLAGSLNIPAVKALYLTGVNDVVSLAKEAGYTGFNDPDNFGLSLVLGGSEVKLLEHVNAYSVFATNGFVNPVNMLLRVEDMNGNILEEFEPRTKNVLDKNVALMVNDILSDNSARSYVFGDSSYLDLPNRPAAAKTGTTNNFKDAWTIGYTPSLVAGVWVGNNNNTEMKRGADGSVIAAPIWNQFMNQALEGTEIENFEEPNIPETGKDVIDGKPTGRFIKVDKETGQIATENTNPESVEEVFFAEHHSILYYIDKKDPLGPIPENPEDDPQFKLWEERILKWAVEQDEDYNQNILDEVDSLYDPENMPVFSLSGITNNMTIQDPRLSIAVEADAPRGVHRVDYYINSNLLERKTSYPFNLDKDISFLSNGYYNLEVLVCDDVLNCAKESVEFNLLLERDSPILTPSLNLIYPTSGLALGAVDFPLVLEMISINSDQIIKIDLFYENISTGDKEKIKTIENVVNQSIVTSWENAPAKGSYRLYAEYHDWNGQVKTTNKVSFTIN